MNLFDMRDSSKRGVLFISVLILLLFAVIFFRMNGNVLLNIPSAAGNETTFCQEINASGVYVLNQSIIGENYSISPCFNITSSDVELDCASYSISNSSADFAIYATYANNISIKNCVIQTSSNGQGIYFIGVNNSFINGNSINSSNVGIYLKDAYSLKIENNQLESCSSGIVLEGGAGNLLQNNILESNSLRGILLNNSPSNNFTNNNVVSEGIGISLSASLNNVFLNNQVSGCASEEGCIALLGSSLNKFYLGNLSSASGFLIYIAGRNELNSSHNLFKDVSLSGNPSLYVNISSSGCTDNSFVNTTYDSSKEYVNAGSELLRKWYYLVFVNSTTHANGIANVNVTIYNSTSSFIISNLTSSNGYILLQTLTEYINTGSKTYFTPYLVLASNTSSSANHTLNLSSNLLNDHLSFNISVSNSSLTTSDEEEEEETVEEEATETAATEATQTIEEGVVEVLESTTNAEESPSPLIYLSESQIEGGYILELNVGDEAYFNISNESHKLKLDSFEKNEEEYTVGLTVSSDPVSFNLKVSEQKKLDFESDDYYDVVVGFDDVTFDDLPQISLSRINEMVVKEIAQDPFESVSTSTDTNSVNFGFLGSIENKINSPLIGPVTPLHIILSVAVLSLVILIYAYIIGRRRSNSQKVRSR